MHLAKGGLKKNKRAINSEALIHLGLFVCAIISVFTTVAIVVTLVVETLSFFKEVSVKEFLLGDKWTPLLHPQHFGILPLLSGTLLVTAISGIVAIPLGLASAIY